MKVFSILKSLLTEKPSIVPPTVEDRSVADARWVPPARPPSRRGKRKTDQELETERAHLAAFMLDAAAKRNARDFQRAKSIGVTHFIWRSCGDDSGVCEACAKLNGKKFRLDKPPVEGLPGEIRCQGLGYCRCFTEMVIPRFA